MGIEIEKKLTEAGYKMLGDDESIEGLILNILKTGNIRYLKAIPFLIYKNRIEINDLFKKIKDDKTERLFKALIAITIYILDELSIKGIISDYHKSRIKIYSKYIHHINLDYKEFRDEFELQLRNENKPLLFLDKQKIYAERDLQMYLSQLFTKKEKQIIRRLLEEKPISRTDYEYYSRKTKKKLKSIIGLQDFAKALYAKTPKYDEDLYNLKKKLEEWIEKKSKDKEISILDYSMNENNEISIRYKEKKDKYSEDKLENIGIKIGKIRDTELLNLLNRYKKHDFR